MKYLIVIFYLVNGEPQGADVLGIAPSADACAAAIVETISAKPEVLKALLEKGVRPQGHCLPAPKFDADSRKLVVTN